MTKRKLGLCERLARDQSGNVTYMVAALTFPVVTAVGGGVDLTRAYMAEARLEQTCDAAALAARKIMDGETVPIQNASDDGSTEVDKFIDYNFPDGSFETAPVIWTSALNDTTGELQLSMQTTMPSAILQFIGVEALSINADCSARRSGNNVDVVLVLDTTGSMSWSMSGSNNGSNERIIALREATLNFLETMDTLRDQLSEQNLRVRVGIVPYASAVNIGRELYEWCEDNIGSGSDCISYDGPVYHAPDTYKFERVWDDNWYYHWADGEETRYGGDDGSDVLGEHPIDLTGFVQSGVADGADPLDPTYSDDNPYHWRGCLEARPTVTTINGSSSISTIPAEAYDIQQTLPNGSVPRWQPFFWVPEGSNSWARPSSSLIDYSNPAFAAFDYSYDMNETGKVPYRFYFDNDYGWWNYPPYKYDYRTIRFRGSSVSSSSYVSGRASSRGPNFGCPDPAILLDEHTEDDLTSYVESLQPHGSTYHDIGMYWGLAIINSEAPFQQPDAWAPAGMLPRPVSRYIVFMTDGDLDPAQNSYSAWGFETAPTSRGLNTRTDSAEPLAEHRARFLMLCQKAKVQGVEISTVAFSNSGGISSADATALTSCATSADQSYSATSASALNDAFQRIAQNIGYLRISQ